VLDAFDEWRRAVGVTVAAAVETPRERGPSLASHLERVIARLTAARAGSDCGFDDTVSAIVRELDAARAPSKSLRGHARAELIGRLAELDTKLLDAARNRLSKAERHEIRRDAEAELAPFRTRMTAAAFEQSVAACMDRLLRDKTGIPTLTLE